MRKENTVTFLQLQLIIMSIDAIFLSSNELAVEERFGKARVQAVTERQDVFGLVEKVSYHELNPSFLSCPRRRASSKLLANIDSPLRGNDAGCKKAAVLSFVRVFNTPLF